ncbi:CpaD family pilus assembly protein [Chthonobacter albigriseus]|uniref:CpaD family pilus assembly protein n=1 Tax=Chthonobacter albigriseus TaxID=1683161 RepID=UPI0015EEC1C4|nr:CpaD family pilus assembly protein [Chthonobacter albigriseus]
MNNRLNPARRHLPFGSARALGRLLVPAALGMAALMSACTSPETLETGSIRSDGYRTRYPIALAEAPETLDIPVGYSTSGLDPISRDSVRSFAANAARKGTGSLVILAPAGSANQKAAAYIAREARNAAVAGGLPSTLIEMRTYPVADGKAAAPIRLSYNRLKAVSPPCGEWTGNALIGHSNDDPVEFGCSTQANLAAMVSNPNDLITPRVMTAASATRRAGSIGKYEAGTDPTGAWKDTNITAGGS